MFKRLGLGLGFIVLVSSFYQGANLFDAGAPPPARAAAKVEDILAAEAQKLNKNKGRQNGHSTFVEAYVRGRTLYHQYEVNLPVGAINTSAVADEFSSKGKAMACTGAFRKLLDDGATLEFNYRTARTKQFIFEARLNASTCRG